MPMPHNALSTEETVSLDRGLSKQDAQFSTDVWQLVGRARVAWTGASASHSTITTTASCPT